MSAVTLRLAMLNLTTIENLTRGTKIWTLAILVPPSRGSNFNTEGGMTPKFPTVSYSLLPASASSNAQNQDSARERVFAILETDQNPFDLGSPLRNLQQVLGYTVCDWLLPIKLSPCTDHSNPESVYALGPVVQRLKQEAGLEAPTRSDREPSNDRPRRGRPRRRKTHVQRRPSPESPAHVGEATDPEIRTPDPRESRHHHRSRDRHRASSISTEGSLRSNRSNTRIPSDTRHVNNS